MTGADPTITATLARRIDIEKLYLAVADIVEQRRERPWRTQAACLGHDPALWFPTRGQTAAVATARQICTSCPVQQQCMQECGAERTGMIAGMTTTQRQRQRRTRITGQPR